MEKYDFSGWATRCDLRCSDGRTIRKGAFDGCDGTVPLVWNHLHNDPNNILGHALLENRDEGVYAYCTLNDTEAGKKARKIVSHGDVKSLSIFANQLKQKETATGSDVLHGVIREVSLVLAGANPGALIDNILSHGEELDDEAIIYSGEAGNEISLCHSDEKKMPEEKEEENKKMNDEKTVKDVIDSMTEEQKNVMYALIGQALEVNGTDENDNKEENEKMKHNVFDNDENNYTGATLSHSEIENIFSDAKRSGSLRESFIAHADSYGIEDIEWLFPDDRKIDNVPGFIKRDTGWVTEVMNAVHHTPFSRIKSMFADLRDDDARALGYTKGNLKKEEVITLLKRSTSPTTIYKKQKLDRDDVVDITDFDVVSWIKGEMRTMLDEEIARAVLIGDGRSSASDDKIHETNIRPIWTDAELYTINKVIDYKTTDTESDKAKAFIKAAIKARKDYKGSGNPVLYTTEDLLADMLLIEDGMGRPLYTDEAALARKMRVTKIVTVPVMDAQTRTVESKTRTLAGIIVNLTDYNIGADKGGSINMFEDFDIDYNQMKYLIETRCSGALIKPYSAIAVEFQPAATSSSSTTGSN